MGSVAGLSSKSLVRLKFFESLFKDYQGFVCIATTHPSAPKATFRERFYEWPQKSVAMENYILSVESSSNVYFCVNLLSDNQRKKASCLPSDLVWAEFDDIEDLSTVDILKKIPPAIIIESSPGKYHTLWRLSTRIAPYQAEIYSRRITYAAGADTSGWDLTQLLRVPFTYNHKYRDRPPVLLERALEAEVAPLIFETIPKPASEDPEETELDQPLPSIDTLGQVENIFYKYGPSITRTGLVAEFTTEPDEDEDWSRVLWRLLHKCFECGMEPQEAFVIARESKCNKYARDGRPVEHLWRDTLKAWKSYTNISVITRQSALVMPQLVDEPASETFLDRYRDWASDATDAIPSFHNLCSAILLSAVVSSSVRLQTSHSMMVPNLWGLVLGDSTLSRKTTAMSMAMDMLAMIDNEMILATDGSPEGLLTGLSTRPNKTSIFFKDEVSGFFDSINRKEYLAGMAETLTQLYDVPAIYRRRLRKEIITIESPAFIFFGGGVRDRVYSAVSDEYVVSGFLPRFLVVSGETDLTKLRRTTRPTNQNLVKRSGLVNELAELYENYAKETTMKIGGQSSVLAPRITADLTDEAWSTYGDIEEKMVRLASESAVPDLALPTFERMSRSLLKLAVILAATRQVPKDDKILINEDDVVNSAWFIQDWGRYSVDLILNAGKSANEKVFDKVLGIIRNKPGIMKSTLMQHHHYSKREADEIIATLSERQQIRIEKFGNGTRYFPD